MGGVFIFLVFLCVCFKFIGVVEESAGVASVAWESGLIFPAIVSWP